MRSYEEIYAKVKSEAKKIVAVAAAEDDTVLVAIAKARELGLCDAIFVGDEEKIRSIATEGGIDIEGIRIIDEKDPKVSARTAAGLVRSGEAHMLMKGLVDTASLLRAVLDKENGLRKGEMISHVGVFEIPGYDRLIVVTDAALNMYPTLKEKKLIIENAVDMLHAFGIEKPKVAAVCAVEVVNEAMQATIDAAMLSKMNERGQIKGCLIDGPLALDNALSEEAAGHKGIKSEVAGKADILLMPNIESGNVLYKALTYTTKSQAGGILLGAKAPVIVTSRADSFTSKVNSIALAVLSASRI